MIAKFAAVLAAATTVVAPSSSGQALIDRVRESIEQARTRQSSLPPPRTIAENLQRLGELDQAPRMVIGAFNFSKIPPDERSIVRAEAGQLIEAVDADNQREMLRLLPKSGWFGRRRYGEVASSAAFHIVQHGPAELQKRFLPVLGRLAKTGDVNGEDYAKMFDRVATSAGRPQRFGTQFHCVEGKVRPFPIENEAGLDARRARIGIDIPFATYSAAIERLPTCA